MKKPHSKKKILFHSCHSRQLSGFGKNCKNILAYLCATGKYEIVEFANAHKWSDKTLSSLPWKCIGSGPNEEDIIVENNENEITSREMSYGLLKLDEVMRQEQPDIYIGSEDIWAFLKTVKKPWWNKINCMLWTTLDSLPLLPEAVEIARNTKHYFTWANFAKKELHKIGLTHTDCLHGSVDIKNFFKLEETERRNIRLSNNINEDDFIIGFVFRNQIRKSVPNLLEGFNLFKKKLNKNIKPKLLLHTGWHEGWDIASLIKEKNIDPNDVLTTYYCSKCKNYKLQSFQGNSCDCPICGSKDSLKTISVVSGPTEKQLNEIYNTMDVYCHPFTSGGQEIPIQEAKLCELITLSTNYSCGEDMNTPESSGMGLEWTEYREPGTMFIKASTCAKSICDKLLHVLQLTPQAKKTMGENARDFIIKNYSIEAVGKKLENIIDNMPKASFNHEDIDTDIINPNYNPPRITDTTSWIIDIYRNIFGTILKKDDAIVKSLIEKINNGKTKEEVLSHLKNLALKEQQTKKSGETFKAELDKTKKERLAVVCDGNKYSAIIAASALKQLKKIYNKDIYIITHPSNFPVFANNEYCYKKINFFKKSTDINYMCGDKGFFELCFITPSEKELKNINRFGKDKMEEKLKV